MLIADLHIHSKYSRATSRDCMPEFLDLWARRKGIGLLGTGDFTHPAWRQALKEKLVAAEEGFYRLRDELIQPDATPGAVQPRFVVTGEISSIYKKNGKTRKVHNVIILPGLEEAELLSQKLEAIGNIHSDGRPILGLDSRDLLEITLESCPRAIFIPAHIWTPHFSLFGAFSGFDTIEECFEDLTGHIHALETGLSSDPAMNARVGALDRFALVSNSDAHSPAKLGREANLLNIDMTYSALYAALQGENPQGLAGTIEFFPEEGKYHLDGHRACKLCLTPAETQRYGGRCPVCGKKLTIGVQHRVEQLADRPEGYCRPDARPYESLVPLPEVIAASTGGSAAGKKTLEQYERLLQTLGPEFTILRDVPIEDLQREAGPCVAEGIRRLRLGQVERRPGFDGEYGAISLLAPAEIQRLSGQVSLFGAEETPKQGEKKRGQLPKRPKAAEREGEQGLQRSNSQQQAAISAEERTVAVVAGPGTGKTKTLVDRIAWLVEERGVRPGEITAVTFTNQAAAEMRQRLEERLGRRAASRMTIGTFHAICLALLGDVGLIGQGEALSLAEETLRVLGRKGSARALLQGVSRVKNGASLETAGLEEEIWQAYCARLEERGMLDFDDLLIRALALDTGGRTCFRHLLVDEFQDINETQYRLVRAWSASGSLFVIGDPDQSIYGFRGADGKCFQRLRAERPELREIRLVENYRSTPEVLEAAAPVIEKNPGGCRRLRPNRPSGPAVRMVRSPDAFSEGVFLAKEIGRMTGGVDMLEAQALGHERTVRAFSDIAVLCRTHRQLELVEKCLRHDDIPCVVSGREDFLEDRQVRGVLAFFRSLQSPADPAALETALGLLWDCPADLAGRARRLWTQGADLAALEEAVRGYGHLELWLDRVKEWEPAVEKEKPWKLVEGWEERYGTSPALEKLRNTAVFYPAFRSLWEALTLGEEADVRRAAGRGWESGAVRLMTLHASKGLEFPAVFVAGLTEGTLPLEMPGRPADLEEERRLLYVGMTRAREELILSAGGGPSPFLDSLPQGVAQEQAGRRQERRLEQLSLF